MEFVSLTYASLQYAIQESRIFKFAIQESHKLNDRVLQFLVTEIPPNQGRRST